MSSTTIATDSGGCGRDRRRRPSCCSRAPQSRAPSPSAIESRGNPDADADRGAAEPAQARAPTTKTPPRRRLRELEQMSETFRNTTFLIAIRDAGFVCNELRGVYGGVNDSTTWTASCSEMLAYTVRVASDGGLGIEPVLQHVDGVPSSADARARQRASCCRRSS